MPSRPKPKFENRQNELIIARDGRQIWNSRSVAVLMILAASHKRDLYFVIEKRGNNPSMDQQGKWCLPCGYLDWDESCPDAIRRELWEEIGIDLPALAKKYRLVDSVEHIDQPWLVGSNPEKPRQNVSLRYTRMIHLLSGQRLPRLIANNDCEPNEVADGVWMNIKNIAEYDFAFNHDQIIKQFVHLFHGD